AVALDENADAAVEGGVRLETVDRQAPDGAAIAAGSEGQSVDRRAGGGAVQLDADDGVVRVGHRVDAGSGLAVAVDGDGVDDRRQGNPGRAGVGAHVDGLHPGSGDVEVDGIVDAEGAGVLGGDVRVAQVIAGVDGR